MNISANRVKELREQTGAGIMECRNVLLETEGDVERALQLLKERSLYKVEKKRNRAASQGLIEAYIHGGRIGAMIEVNCETDFTARTDEFKTLAHHLAMQVAAMMPQYVSQEDIPEGVDMEAKTACLLQQADIKNPDMTVQDTIDEVIAKVGENIVVSRFARFELGEQ